MRPVIVSGGGDDLGRRVATHLARLGVTDVRVLPSASPTEHVHGPDGEHEAPAGTATDLTEALASAGALVHLGGSVDETRAVLAAAGAAGITTVVLLSSATVYGAWPSNPVPLTEDAILRPNAELAFAVRAAERERLALEWKLEHPGATVALLRAATPVAEDAVGWLARGLQAAAAIRSANDDEPPAQFLHLDDLASAAALAATKGLDGPFNVAPDGWIDGTEVAPLGGRPRLRLPGAVATRLASVGNKLRATPVPEGLVPYTRHPWVVANDRLKAEGWEPTNTNAEAYVAGTRPAPWSTVSPQRRQELALGGAAAALVGVGTAVALGVRRLRRRR